MSGLKEEKSIFLSLPWLKTVLRIWSRKRFISMGLPTSVSIFPVCIMPGYLISMLKPQLESSLVRISSRVGKGSCSSSPAFPQLLTPVSFSEQLTNERRVLRVLSNEKRVLKYKHFALFCWLSSQQGKTTIFEKKTKVFIPYIRVFRDERQVLKEYL